MPLTAPRPARPLALCCAVLAALLLGAPALALRVIDYNLLNYPGSTGTSRAPFYRTVLAPLDADIIVAEEICSAAGPTQFLNEVLQVMEPGEWATAPFVDGHDTDASIFYKPAKVQFLEQSAFYPNPSNPLRYVHVYRMVPAGYDSPGSELRIYAAHLKASQGYESQRLAECIGIRDHLNAMPAGTHALLCGDLNFYEESTEPGYAKLLESQAINIGRLYDLLPGGDWHDNPSPAVYHTQSPCRSGTCASGAATGGMDDRFDFILPTLTLGTGQGMAMIPGTCLAAGNDGLHLNLNITDDPVIPEGEAYATALQLASDHLPLRADLQVPARIATDALLAFDPVIVGAPAPVRELLIANPAEPPADALDCAFAPPSGFGAPSGLTVAPGDAQVAPITLATVSAGPKNGTLTIASDAPDDATVAVDLTAAVLDHAAASLDSVAIQHACTLDFGEHEPGAFDPQSARVFNAGYHPYQARLAITGAGIAGGDGRFALIDGLDGPPIGGSGQDFVLTFDPAGATLTVTSVDEPLPGAMGAAGPDRLAAGAGDGWSVRHGRDTRGGRHPAPRALTQPARRRNDPAAGSGARGRRERGGLRSGGPVPGDAAPGRARGRTPSPHLGRARRRRRALRLRDLLRPLQRPGPAPADRSRGRRPVERARAGTSNAAVARVRSLMAASSTSRSTSERGVESPTLDIAGSGTRVTRVLTFTLAAVCLCSRMDWTEKPRRPEYDRKESLTPTCGTRSALPMIRPDTITVSS
jgi:hypothetical protein